MTRIVAPLLLSFLALQAALAEPASAQGKVVVVKSANAPVIDELAAGFRSAFPGAKGEDVLLTDATTDAQLAAKLAGAAAVMSVGPKAASAVARAKPGCPTIAVVPGPQADPKAHGATLRLQPPADGIVALASWLGYKKLGLITDAGADERVGIARVLAASHGITLFPAQVQSAREVAATVSVLLRQVDALVVDVSEGLTSQDVQFLLRSADAERKPLIGTSEGFIKAGAPIAIAIDPRNVGAEAGTLAASGRTGMSDPRRFRVVVNLLVTERLGLAVPQERGIVAENILTLDTDAGELAAAPSRVAVRSATQPEVLRRARLTYPPIARAAGVRTGEVVLEILVKSDGSIGATKVVKGDQLFTDAAIASVKNWQFRPGSVDGKPTDGTLRLNLKFQQ